MGIFSFYNMRKPRQFDHKPIYWDPHKEEMEERQRKIRIELGLEKPDENFKPRIKGTFIEGTKHLKRSVEKGEDARSRKYKSSKLIVALVILGLIFWYLFWS